MKCQLCYKELTGDVVVNEREAEGYVVIGLTASPDRNWIACDSCNALLCHDCCQYPESGYCDPCIAQYRLKSYLIDEGLIKEP